MIGYPPPQLPSAAGTPGRAGGTLGLVRNAETEPHVPSGAPGALGRIEKSPNPGPLFISLVNLGVVQSMYVWAKKKASSLQEAFPEPLKTQALKGAEFSREVAVR